MCGIAGLFAFQHDVPEAPARDAILRRMTGLIAHRGPDDEGIWHDPQGRCSLGHRRLSIIDTSSAGHQPMLDAGERWVITYNGEVYNFADVRAELQSRGVTFRGRTDTEVLLQAVMLWGVEALPRFDGMFAFAAFDRESGQIILARDAFGEKPLYYAELRNGGVAFASELQALEAVPNVDLNVSIDSVAELLMFQYIGAPRTIYRNVKKLPPGHWLIATPGQTHKIGKYFEFRPGKAGFDERPIDQLADELEDILVRSLHRRLISDVPLGAFLSGGVDSSTVCALIRRRLGVPLKTFSIGFKDAPESEHEAARAFAEHLGTEHHDKIIKPDASDFLLNIGNLLDEPNADSSCLPTYLLSAFARETVTVAISGDGGDEMFAGYGRYFATLDDSHRIGTGNGFGSAYYSNRILVSVEQHIEELLGSVPHGARDHLTQLRDEIDRSDVPLFCRLRRSDVENYMPGAVLPKVDRMSMRRSLEVRTPFLSVELARFAERLPQNMLYDGKRGKLLLREVAYRYLPRELIDLPKKGFGLPMTRWGQDELVKVAARMLESEESRLAVALGRDAIARFMRRQRSDGGFATYQVWALTMLESWLRHHPARLDEATIVASSADHSTSPPQIQLWEIAERVLVVSDVDAANDGVQADRNATSFTSSSELVQIIAACPKLLKHVTESKLAVCRPVSKSIDSWSALARGQCSPDTKQALRGSTLLLVETGFCDVAGWSEFEGLRNLGVARMMMLHPHREDGSVVSIAMNTASVWREHVDLLALNRAALGRKMLKKPRTEQGCMWVAGPSSDVPVIENEMSDRFALFEGTRQLPPLPVSHINIQRLGDGRYSVWSNHVYFSSTKNAKPPRFMWMVERNSSTQHRLRFATEIIAPLKAERGPPFLEKLKAAIAADEAVGPPLKLKRGDKVVVLTHALPPGGAERQWCYLAGELKKMGYEVHFVTLFPLEGQSGHYLPLLASEGIEVTQLNSGVGPCRLLKDLRSALQRIESGDLVGETENPFGPCLHSLANLLARLKPKALFAQLDYPNLIAGTAGLLASVRQIVLSFRNYNPSHFPYLASDWYQPVYAALARSPRIVLTGNSRASNADYAQWMGIDERRVKLVPNAIDAAKIGARDLHSLQVLRQQLGVTSCTPIILGVFRLSEEKRPILFVETFAAVATRVPGARAFIAGIGLGEKDMRRRIDELGLRDSMTLLGRRDDVPELMQISSLLLLTSSFEGMPNVVMEAQAVGLPVVASNVGGVSDCMIDGTTGYLVDRDDVEGFARRCSELLQDDQLRNRLSANGAAYMRSSFSRHAMAERYLQILMDDAIASDQPETLRATIE